MLAAMPATFARRRQAHLRLGRRGERCAAVLLRAIGIEVLLTNYRSRRGEIDIIARDGLTLCFVEVKTRRRLGRFRPAAAVGRAKRQRIRACARDYLRELHNPPLNCRFDVIELILPRWQQPSHAYFWANAFGKRELPQPADFWP